MAYGGMCCQVHGGWVLNGQKRWIGNATFAEIVVVWARNLDTKQINAFVVHKGSKGFATSKIENKIALRCVQNADIRMTDVFVPDSARLTGVNTFQVCACWICRMGSPAAMFVPQFASNSALHISRRALL